MDKTLVSNDKFTITILNFDAAARPRLRFNPAKQGPPVTSNTGDGFTLIRRLGMVAFEDSDNPGGYPRNLGQTIKIRVNYTQADLDAAQGYPLKLAYWNGSNWVVFATPTLVGGANGGYGELTFSSTPWNGDPETSWGR